MKKIENLNAGISGCGLSIGGRDDGGVGCADGGLGTTLHQVLVQHLSNIKYDIPKKNSPMQRTNFNHRWSPKRMFRLQEQWYLILLRYFSVSWKKRSKMCRLTNKCHYKEWMGYMKKTLSMITRAPTARVEGWARTLNTIFGVCQLWYC